MILASHLIPHPSAAGAQLDLAAPDADDIDRILLSGYSPADSLAWPGAAPATMERAQLDFWWDSPEVAVESIAGERSPFRRAGYTVRPIRGKGAARIIDDFCRLHHRYLRSRGMAGAGFGFYTPDDELVGIANFAPCSNPRTATGMQIAGVPEDQNLSERELSHIRIGEREYTDCVRLCVAESTGAGIVLGTGAESFLYAACVRHFYQRNRQLWRAIRMAELGFPLPHWASNLLGAGTEFMKLIRTFADPAQQHSGGIYTAAGAWYLGTTRTTTVYIGRRSGESITQRAVSKLRGTGHGHLHQTLRAAYEGSNATARLTSGGEIRMSIDLRTALADLPAGLDGTTLRKQLAARWREIAGDASPAGFLWELRADVSGYRVERRPPKHLYGTYLGAPYWAGQMMRRCRRLRPHIIGAEAAWYSPARRAGRSLGYNWRRPAQPLGRLDPPRRLN